MTFNSYFGVGEFKVSILAKNSSFFFACGGFFGAMESGNDDFFEPSHKILHTSPIKRGDGFIFEVILKSGIFFFDDNDADDGNNDNDDDDD